MQEDILVLIQENAYKFSKGQRAIASYITEFYEKAAFMTAKKLGKTVGVSESTVVRFATELGYAGYPQMQKSMQGMVMNRLTSVQRIEVANDRIGDQDILSMVIQSDIEKLRQTAEMISREHFSKAVEAILRARRVYIMGSRSTSVLANFLGHYLRHMLDSIYVVTSSGASEMFEQIIGAGPEDVVIAFSFPRYSTATFKGAQFFRSLGATVVGITDSALSPLGSSSDYVLQCKSDMISLVDSLTAPFSVANALIVAIASRREQALSETFSSLEKVWEEYKVYEKRVDA